MTDARFVHIVDDVPELAGDADAPAMIVALEGFLDAGNAASIAVESMLDDDRGRVVASFEVDEFYDYRARRPPITFSENHYTDYEAPRLVVRLLKDAAESPYLLLSGPEPDIRWEAFCGAVRAVVNTLGVREVWSLSAVPMSVPHTRPIQLTQHANLDEMVTRQNIWQGELRVPSSAQGLLEMRLGDWDVPAGGFVAHIPHYVAQMPYPMASAALLEAVGESTGLSWDLTDLREAGAKQGLEIEEQVSENAEVREVVTGLERQYDAFQRSQEQGSDLLAQSRDLPSGDELGAEFERFLAGLNREDPLNPNPEES